MIIIENTDVYGFDTAIRGCRNPKNSWGKSDSYWEDGEYKIGENDLKLMKTLAVAGDDHGKYLRMISVTCDITAPTYWIAEHDTYKVGTVRDSCSFMHKGLSEPFSLVDFSISSNDKRNWSVIVSWLNEMRSRYIQSGDEELFREIRQMLPSGYNQTYTWAANYQVLRHIYHARKNHRLPEWKEFCKWIEGLPYAEELICSEKM